MSLTRNLTQPLTRAITNAITQAGAGGAFDPVVAYFSNGEQGAVYDPSDLTTLWQGPGRMNQVTAAGQTVAVMDDKSGRGNHMAFTDAVLLQDAGGKYYIAYNGTTTFGVTDPIDFSASNKIVVCAGLYYTGAAAAAMFELGANSATVNGGFGLIANNLVSGNIASLHRITAPSGRDAVRAAGAAFVFSVQYSGAVSVTGGSAFRLDGLQAPRGSNIGSTGGVGNFGNLALYTGKRGGASLPWAGRLYGLVITTNDAGEASRQALDRYMAGKAGTDSPYSYAPSFADNGALVPMGAYALSSPFAQAEFVTTATSVEVTGSSNLFSTRGDLSALGVMVNGVYQEAINATADGALTQTVYFPSGSKTVSIVSGPQSKPSSTVLGTFISGLRANAAITPSGVGVGGITIYGDSISVGDASSPVMQKAWALQVRAAAYGSQRVAVEGWGYRSLYDDCANSTLRAAFVAKMVAYNPTKIWLAIGTNDYGLNKWSAASFGTAYAALLDDLHTALPSAAIYCQTPLLRTTETANGSGSTLGDYRTAIGTAVSTRTAYATLVDGTAFMTTASLSDGLHPSTAGHDLYAAAVIAELGI